MKPKNNDKSTEPKDSGLSPRVRRGWSKVTSSINGHPEPRSARAGKKSILARMKSAIKSSTESPLLALPAELRNEIWKFAAPRFGAFINLCQGYSYLYEYSRLLLCCRQMKNEVQPFFDEVRAQLFHDTELVLTVTPSGDSKAYLGDLFQYVDRLRDEDLADMKRLRLRSSDPDIEALPTCSFANGAWYCQWTPSFPSVPHSSWVVQYSGARREEVSRSLDRIFGTVTIISQDFNFLGRRFQGEAVLLGSRASQQLIRGFVTAAMSERLSKERLKLMLAFQYEFRAGCP